MPTFARMVGRQAVDRRAVGRPTVVVVNILGAARKHTKEESLSHSQNEKGDADVRFVWVCPVCPLCVSRLPPVLLRSIYMYLD